MARNIVTEQNSVDPNELQRTRRNPSLNTPGVEQQTELPPPAPAPLDVDGNAVEQPLPQPEPDDVLGDYSLKGYFVPPRNEDPAPLPVLESDDERLQDLQQQAQQQQLGDSFILSQQLRSRVVDAYNTSTRNRYVPTVTNGYDPININDTARYLDERRQAVLQQTRPLGTNPEEGILGVGRNILSGRPFTRATEQILSDQFTRMGEEGYQSRIERFYRWLPQPLRGLVANPIATGAENLVQLLSDIRQAERRLVEEDPEYRTLGRRVLDELRKANPFEYRGYAPPEYNRFRSVTEQPGPLLQELSESSPVFRQIMNDLGPTLGEAGNAVFNPLQGQWGEFGSAGSLSAALYLLNIPEGVLVGTLYDVADDVRNIAGVVNPEWRPPERNLRRIDALSPFVGRDIGFTQRYSEDKYLSAAGNPALRRLDPRLQWAAGFVGDLVAGGVADAVFDGLIGPGRRAALRSARGTLDEATNPASAAVREASNSIARFEGVSVASFERQSRGLIVTETAAKSPASEATLPLLPAPTAVVEETPVQRYNPFRTARQGGSINTVEEYVEQIASVLNRIDETPAIIRQAEVADMATVRRSMAEAQANYEATLESMVRQVDSAARSMTQQNFRSLVESFMRQVAKNGTEVAADGAIVLRQPDAYVDALSTAVRSELVTPWYRQFPEVLDTYREAPLALPPQAFDLTRRPTDDVVELAKMWEVLPPSATSNNLRITQLSRSNPEFGRVWGTQIDEGVSAAVRRVVVQPEDGLNNLAERSRVVGSAPSARIGATNNTASPINLLLKDDVAMPSYVTLEPGETLVGVTAGSRYTIEDAQGNRWDKFATRTRLLSDEESRLRFGDAYEARERITLDANASESDIRSARVKFEEARDAIEEGDEVYHIGTEGELRRGTVESKRLKQAGNRSIVRLSIRDSEDGKLIAYSHHQLRGIVGDITTVDVNVVTESSLQLLNEADAETRLSSIRREYAEEAARVVNLSPARQRSAFNRMQQLQQEGAELIADYPEVAARIIARDYTLDPKYETPRDLTLGQAVLNVEYQQATYNQLMDELNVVNRRVEQQQQILRQLPPLERRSPHNEINTRLSAGEDPVVRSVNNSTSIGTDTIYQAARLEVWNDPRLRTADVTVAQLLESGELSSLPEREAMAVLQNMRDNDSIRLFEDGPRGLEETSLIVDPNSTYVGLAVGSRVDNERFLDALGGQQGTATVRFNSDGSVRIGDVDIPVNKRLEIVEASAQGKRVTVDLADTNEPIKIDYSETVIGSGAYGQAVLRQDGTLIKRGRITEDEVRLQRKAALQGLAPEVLSEVAELGPDTREFAMQFLSDFKPLSDFADYDSRGLLQITGFPPETVPTVRQNVFDLIDKLHRAGINHNDLHEANLMINPDTLEVKAIDFGLATESGSTKLRKPVAIPDKVPIDPEYELPILTYKVSDRVEFTLTVDRSARTALDIEDTETVLNVVDPNRLRRGRYAAIDFSIDDAQLLDADVMPISELNEMRMKIQDIIISNPNHIFYGVPGAINPEDTYRKYLLYYRNGFDLVDGEAGAFVGRQLTFEEYFSNSKYYKGVQFYTRQPETGLPTGPRNLPRPMAGSDALTDYSFVADFLFNKPTFYRGTRYARRFNNTDIWSLSNEFGPAVYLTDDLAKAERYAKAIPSQDVVTSSTNRVPRREPIGNVQAVVLDIPQESIKPVEDYRDNIFRAFDTVLNVNGETRLRRNFKAWVKRNEDPTHWWHYLRERFTDDRLADLARLQLEIRDNLVSQGVRAFYSPATKDVVVIDPSAILHRSVPHTVEAQGSVIEGLVNRNAVDSELLAALDNKTTRAIDAHNKLNIDTYVENQLKAAVGEQEIEVLNSIRELNQQRQLQQADWLNNRQTTRRNIIDELEREAGSNIRKFLRSQDDFCL